MQNLGIVKPGSKLILNWDTFDGGDGSSITMTDFVAGDIEIYKDVDFVTQRASDSGYALLDDGIDVDAITGVHAISIDLADNTTVGFWACGSHYSVRIGPVTIDAQTVNFWLAEFTIGQPDAFLNTTIASITDQDTFVITNGPAEADALNGCVVLIQDVASKVQLGFAVVTDYIVTSKTVQLLAGPTYTLAATDSISFFPPANTHWFGQAIQGGDGVNLTETGGDGAQLTEAGGDGDHLNEAGGDGDQFTGIASVGAVAGAVGSVAGNVDGNVSGSVASNIELGPSEVQTEVDTAIATARLDELLTADSDIDGAAPPTVGSVFHELMTKTTGSFTYDQTTDALEALRDHIADGTSLTEAGGDGDQLTAINLPNQTMDITGNLSGSVGSVSGAVGSVAGNVDGNVSGSVASNVELGPSEVNAEVVDVMRVDTLTATPQGAPPTTPTIEQAIMVLYDALVHKVKVDATSKEFSNNAGTVVWKKALSDDATDYTEAESASGP